MKLSQIKKILKPRRSLRSHLGAGIAEYAIIVGLVAVAGMGAVAMTGEKVAELFGGVGNEVSDVANTPSLTLSTSAGAIAFAESSEFSWEVQNASSVEARYSLAGSCAEANDAGSGPHALSWAGTSGSEMLSWSPDLAGCSFDVEMTASNAVGEAADSAAVDVELPDTTPENLTFAPKGGAEPGQITISEPALVTDIEADATIESGAVAGEGASLISGAPQFELTVAPETQIQLHATASSTFGETRSVPFSAGAMSGSWQLTTRAADTSANAFDLGIGPLNLATGQSTSSNVVTFAGFEAPIDLTITPTLNANAGQLAYRLDGAAWTPLNAAASLSDVNAGTSLQLRLTAASTYQTTAQAASVLVAIGGRSDSWSAGIAAQDRTANGFTFSDRSGAARSTTYTSNTITLAGFTGTLNLNLTSSGSGSAFSYSLNGGGYTNFTSAASVTVAPNTTLTLRMTASTAYSTPGHIGVSLNGVGDTWSVTTENQPVVQCAGGTVSWGGCSGTLSTHSVGQSQTLSYYSGKRDGQATYTCTASGAWQLQSGSYCYQDHN